MISELAAKVVRLQEALKRIIMVEMEGNCCGCSHDSGFDEIKRIAQEALDGA